MPGHSRSQNGVALLAYGAGHPDERRTVFVVEIAGKSPAMTGHLRT
jgi:hypothetical protein